MSCCSVLIDFGIRFGWSHVSSKSMDVLWSVAPASVPFSWCEVSVPFSWCEVSVALARSSSVSTIGAEVSCSQTIALEKHLGFYWGN